MEERKAMSSNDTLLIPGTIGGGEPREPETPAGPGDLTDELTSESFWTDRLLADAGIPVVEAPFVSVGGGIGSFVMADYLRIAGVPASAIRVLTALDEPWETYKYLTRVSQIPEGERLRSDAASTPDNIWGFPSYAVREAVSARRPTKIVAPLFQVLTEPVVTDYFTPRAGQVFRGMRREAARINWWSMPVKGTVRMVRRRRGGGYFSLLTPPAGTSATKRVAYKSPFVHVAVGYPGVKFLPDLQEYRSRYQDFGRVVNAYEPHEHVYEALRHHPSTVIVRGAGIVASRILQRLIDDRDTKGSQTTIIQLFRTYVDGPQGSSLVMRRKGGHGWAYQGFNWPKSTWGGQLLHKVEKLEGDDRKRVYEANGGTTTPKRKLWQKQLDQGRRDGWYREAIGQVVEVKPGPNGTVVTRIRSDAGILEIPANFIVDATGLEADIREHRLLADLLDHGGAERNPLGKLAVERTFEIRGARNEPGRAYAVGAPTLGSYFPGVDTFLGLQYGALRITDDLASLGFCKRIGTARSITQWWRWMLNIKI
jgi:hypothetical protein